MVNLIHALLNLFALYPPTNAPTLCAILPQLPVLSVRKSLSLTATTIIHARWIPVTLQLAIAHTLRAQPMTFATHHSAIQLLDATPHLLFATISTLALMTLA